MKLKSTVILSTAENVPIPQHPKGNMAVSQTPSSAAERRLAIARRLYQALVAQDPDRAITFCDAGGRVVARHDPQFEQGAAGRLPQNVVRLRPANSD